jgi:hypothetical protein
VSCTLSSTLNPTNAGSAVTCYNCVAYTDTPCTSATCTGAYCQLTMVTAGVCAHNSHAHICTHYSRCEQLQLFMLGHGRHDRLFAGKVHVAACMQILCSCRYRTVIPQSRYASVMALTIAHHPRARPMRWTTAVHTRPHVRRPSPLCCV